ncbi:MAG TPA: hypothetical protein VGJ26_05715 [Pirellulales bacterium]
MIWGHGYLLEACAMQVWVIDDEEYMRSRVVPPMVLARWPDAQITAFDALATAIYKERAVDLIIIDITSVCPIMRATLAYGPICDLLEKHPGVTLIINSALPLYVTDVVRKSILEFLPDAKVLLSPFPCHINLPRVLGEVV